MPNFLTRWYNNLLLTSGPRSPEQVAQAIEPDFPPFVPASDPWWLPEPVFTFTGWPKTVRFLRDIVITEKLDGTNAAVIVRHVTGEEYAALQYDLYNEDGTIREESGVILVTSFDDGESYYLVGAQSRNRVISVHQDNQGFAKWVQANGRTLAEDLGDGLHFGEFWGSKIGRTYGLADGDRRFSLFNPSFGFGQSFGHPEPSMDGTYQVKTPGLSVVPVLYEGPLDTAEIRLTLSRLQTGGSRAVPGYTNPEGIVIYHTHARKVWGKVTLDNQDAGKWELA